MSEPALGNPRRRCTKRPTPAAAGRVWRTNAGWRRSGRFHYQQQDELPGIQTVRVWGDTAVVTALLWLQGTSETGPFDRRLWFSDTYVRTPEGWKYAFGQASLALSSEPAGQ